MNNAITVKGHVLVSDILLAFEPMVPADELEKLDDLLEKRRDERVTFDDCEVLVEEAIDALFDAGKLPETEALAYTLDEGDVIGLAEAIRCGERERAELLLDVLFAAGSDVPTIREWIDRGRFSKKAREAKAAEKGEPTLKAVA